MNDRELLEQAARAGGVRVYWCAEAACLLRADCIGTVPWNPLADDGDALRLAVDLELVIEFGENDGVHTVLVGYYLAGANTRPQRFMIEHFDGKQLPRAATRRAIVRAAAALAKGE